MKEIYVVSLQRSGTHAIINWMADSLAATGHVQVYLDPFNPYELANRTPKKLARDDTSTIIVSVEDRTMDDAKILLANTTGDGYLPIGTDPDPMLIVILRDPFNLFASRRMFNQRCQLGNTSQKAIDCWKDHAWFALNGKAILYNHWFTSRGSRWCKARNLGFNSNDSTIETVSNRGNGSSFDGMHFDGRASQMATNERWKTFRRHPSFWAALNDVDIHNRTRTLFPETYTTILSYIVKATHPCQSKQNSSTASIESSKPTQEGSPSEDTVQP